MKKLYGTAFLLLLVISLLFSLAIFISGSLILLNIELYKTFYQPDNIWLAFMLIIPETALLSYIFFLLIKELFFFTLKKKEGEGTDFLGIKNMLMMGMFIYEVAKFIKRIKK